MPSPDRPGHRQPALPTAILTDIAHRVARHEPLWRAVAHHDPRERRPIRLIGADRYEVWGIGWTHRQGVVLHDHGGSAGALLVVEGTLAEDSADLDLVVATGGLVIDIRPLHQRERDGLLPGALVIDRNVLEWRLDPEGAHRVTELTGRSQPVVVVCDEGYASSLAAASLQRLGLWRATDLAGGFQAWRRWLGARRAVTGIPRPDCVDPLPA